MRFDNTYFRELAGLYEPWLPTKVKAPSWLFFNTRLASDLGLDCTPDDEGLAIFAGNVVPPGANPIAQAYAGHQFGHFSPVLGDGRALLLGEVLSLAGERFDIALKGSGRTPFSRRGDGKAAVGPMLREVLISEAMHALGIPTTRSLAVVATGESVLREQTLPGAILTRVASSHIRVGTFELFAAHGAKPELKRLTAYAIARHDPDLSDLPSDESVMTFFERVCQRQARLIAQWMNVGFIHGVMNTDNMAISGETIDYGPCAFMEGYDEAAVFSSIDELGRYAYGRQPRMALWNLARFADALLPVVDDEATGLERFTAIMHAYQPAYQAALSAGQRRKLGLAVAHADDDALVRDWLALLQADRVDFTTAWRALAGPEEGLSALFYDSAALASWYARWQARIAMEARDSAVVSTDMLAANPRIIARNQEVELALAAASDEGDLTPFQALLEAVRHPFSDDERFSRYTLPAPAAVTAGYKTFCGT
jgi:serine/tyrosine/threonine adenylyltransferase